MPLHTCTVHVSLMSVVLDLKLKVKISYKLMRRDTGCAGKQSLILYGRISLNMIKSGVLKSRSLLK